MLRSIRALGLSLVLLAAGMPCVARGGLRPAPGPVATALPLAFERNDGQVAPEVRLVARSGGMGVGIEPLGIVLMSSTDRLRVSFGETNRRMPQGEAPLPGIVSYFIGNDRARWHTAIPTFARVRIP